MSPKQTVLAVARPSSQSTVSEDAAAPQGPEWQAALERVVLYLKVLNVPPLEASEITREALKQAAETVERDHRPPVAAAMLHVRRLICGPRFSMGELKPAQSGSAMEKERQCVLPFSGIQEISPCVPVFDYQPGAEQSMPLIGRTNMVPGDFERSPWRFLWTFISVSPAVP